MLRSADIRDFLLAHGINEQFALDGENFTMPDRLVGIIPTGGGGTSHERAFDQASVQIRVRGAQNDTADAEALADAVDAALMAPVAPIRIGGRPVVRIDYTGGPFAFLRRDQAQRVELVCNYLVEIAR